MYAIKICLDGKDDWIYVTEDTGGCDWTFVPKLFANKQEAIEYSKTFKKQNVKVVKYES